MRSSIAQTTRKTATTISMTGGGKSWWAAPYTPGRPDPFTAPSPLGDDDLDEVEVATSSSSTQSASALLVSEPAVSVIKGSMGTLTSTGKGGSRKMVEIAPSPSDPFHYGTSSTTSRNDNDRQEVPPPSRLPTIKNDNYIYVKETPKTRSGNSIGRQDVPPPSRLPTRTNEKSDYEQQAPRARSRNMNDGPTSRLSTMQNENSDYEQRTSRARTQPPPLQPPPLNDDIYERRRNNNRESAITMEAAPGSFSDVTYASADAARQRPRRTDNLKSAAVPLYGSDEQTSISSDRNNGMRKKPSKPNKVRRRKASSPIDTDVIKSPRSYGSDVQSSIPASTNAFFQRPPKRREGQKTRMEASASFESGPSYYTGDVDSEEDPSIQSVYPQRTNLPSQSGGSMSLFENYVPFRPTNHETMQSSASTPFFYRSGGEAASRNGMDFVNYLETRGMRDNGKSNLSMMPRQEQQIQWQQLQNHQWQQQEVNPEYQRSIITRAKNRTPPTKLDVAASTLGGSLLGASIGLAGVLNPDLGLNIVGQSAMLPPLLWAAMIGTVGYAGGIADNDAGYSIRHVFSLGSGLKTGIKSFVLSARETVDKTAREALRMVSGQEDPPARIHHVTIKTQDIVSAMEFYSLLGFESKSKFRVGKARATWLDNVVVGAGRIELIEVPSDMLEQGSSSSRRALDRVRNQVFLGWNHMTLDVSDLMRKKGFGSLSEFLAYLNEKSFFQCGKGISLAVGPQKQAIGDHIYDTTFIYDPDGSMIQLQYLKTERANDYRVSSFYYGEPTGGQDLVDQSQHYQGWW